jgi:hypothetical protein
MKKFGFFINFRSCQSPEVVKSSKNRQISALGFRIKDFYFVCGLYSYLAKSSYV